MSTPQSPIQPSPHNCPVIAGQGAGKPIRCVPELKPVYDRLQQAALRNHHWARIAVKELNALTTGMLGKSNVYVRPGERQHGTGSEKYYVFLPGLKATVVRWMNDQFCILELVIDDNYYRTQDRDVQQSRLGTYRASLIAETGKWRAKYERSGQANPQIGRLVTVADASYESANEAANYSIPGALTFFGDNTSAIERTGCDVHFTPGPKRLGGLFRYNSLSIDASRSSAVHLAATMEAASTIESVAWVADFGGSAVLTQAMQILVDKGVSLEGHTIFLHRPRTSPAKALKLAHQLKLSLNKRFANTGVNPRGALSQFSVAGARMNNRNDPYGRDQHAMAWFKGAVAISTPVGVGAALASGPAMVMLGSVATAIGGAGAVYAIGQSVTEDMRRRFKF